MLSWGSESPDLERFWQVRIIPFTQVTEVPKGRHRVHHLPGKSISPWMSPLGLSVVLIHYAHRAPVTSDYGCASSDTRSNWAATWLHFLGSWDNLALIVLFIPAVPWVQSRSPRTRMPFSDLMILMKSSHCPAGVLRPFRPRMQAFHSGLSCSSEHISRRNHEKWWRQHRCIRYGPCNAHWH